MRARFLNEVVLDPFPFGGGVTSLEALSVGAPVVTLPSHQSVVRLAHGFYKRMTQAEDDARAKGVKAEVQTEEAEEAEEASRTAWPVARTEGEMVELALSLGRSAGEPGGLRVRLGRRIRAAHGELYDDAEAPREWTKLLVKLARHNPSQPQTALED